LKQLLSEYKTGVLISDDLQIGTSTKISPALKPALNAHFSETVELN